MKKLILLALLLPLAAIAQTITISGTVTDAANGQPVDMVSVGALDSNIATITNESGEFRLTVPTATPTLYFSHLSYKTGAVTLKGADEKMAMKLDPAEITLEDVVVSNKPVKELLKDAVSASKNRLEKSLLLNTYYREFGKVNEHYLKFADGLLDYHVKKKSGSADLYVQQSRAKQLVSNDLKIFKKLDTKEGENNADLIGALNIYDVRDAVAEASDFRIVKRVLDADNYDYTIKLRKNSEGKDVEIITITPKPEVKEVLFEGYVIYESASKLIMEIDLKLAESHQQYSKSINVLLFRMKILGFGKKIAFRNTNNKYIMAYSQNRIKFYVSNKNQFDDTFDFMSDVVTIDYKEGEFEFDRKKRYKNKDLYSAGNNYTTEYWKTANMLLLTDAEEQVLKSFN